MTHKLQCPVCTKDMRELAFGSTWIDVCAEGCGGLWFGRGELERLDSRKKGAGPALEAALRREPVPANEGRELDCPVCRDPLVIQEHELAPIEIDVCETCDGAFLDAGELAVLRQRKLSRSELGRWRARRHKRQRRKAEKERQQRNAVIAGVVIGALM